MCLLCVCVCVCVCVYKIYITEQYEWAIIKRDCADLSRGILCICECVSESTSLSPTAAAVITHSSNEEDRVCVCVCVTLYLHIFSASRLLFYAFTSPWVRLYLPFTDAERDVCVRRQCNPDQISYAWSYLLRDKLIQLLAFWCPDPYKEDEREMDSWLISCQWNNSETHHRDESRGHTHAHTHTHTHGSAAFGTRVSLRD